MDDLERELKVGFLDEAEQMLADAEQCFLSLETASSDQSIIDQIFRLAHNLKGTSRAVGFMNLAEFTHVFESLLLKIKSKEIQIERGLVDLLLKCNDHLKVCVQLLKMDLNGVVDHTELVTQLQAVIDGKASVSQSPAIEATLPIEASEFPSADDPQFGETAVVEVDPFADLAPIVAQSVHQSVAKAIVEAEVKPVAETAKTAPKAAAPADENIRVSLSRLEKLMNNVGELVILQTVLTQQKHMIPSPLLQRTISHLGKVTKEIQDVSMSLRMVPLKPTFQKMQRIVRDTSAALSKEVVLHISGEESELDKTVLDHLGDPLVHLVRNAVDHGLETTEERVAAGKPRQGNVSLNAYHQGGHIVIEVRDDGKGMDADRLRAKALEKGILRPGQTITDKEAYFLIFHPGFSTKAEVTDISGRGVGLDVVKTNVDHLQGEIQLETVKGQGSRFLILLPLTLAIIDGMVVQVGSERYVVPITQVYESLQPQKEDLHHVTGMGDVLNLRGETIPIYRLGQVLRRPSKDPKPAFDSTAIIVRSGNKNFSILVDEILGQQQVVIKRLGTEIQNLRGISGSAILGDGRAALILDFVELIHRKEAA